MKVNFRPRTFKPVRCECPLGTSFSFGRSLYQRIPHKRRDHLQKLVSPLDYTEGAGKGLVEDSYSPWTVGSRTRAHELLSVAFILRSERKTFPCRLPVGNPNVDVERIRASTWRGHRQIGRLHTLVYTSDIRHPLTTCERRYTIILPAASPMPRPRSLYVQSSGGRI